MKPILEVRNLWKQYKIGGQQASYLSLREKLLQPFQRQKMDTFWALKDINFDIFEGECVGIIGRNGAGKSTLLKILSQITPPTKGYIKARGRVASLLEVGTGFHPELTGRENIYLNGSILGLKRSEINAKFDEIIDFSGIEKFLDTPLKHYSSGMKLRLAFSVAAHLEPEILLIDEVLAVGDAEFQKKCLGKMDEVSRSGRTVLFVSHNMNAVRQLCNRGILLQKGSIELISNIDLTLDRYLENNSNNEKHYDEHSAIRYLKIEQIDDKIILSATYESSKPLFIPSLGFTIYNNLGFPVTGFNPTLDNKSDMNKKYNPDGEIMMTLTRPNLLDGTYSVTIWFGDGYHDFFVDKHCLKLKIQGMTSHKQLPPAVMGSVMPDCNYIFS